MSPHPRPAIGRLADLAPALVAALAMLAAPAAFARTIRVPATPGAASAALAVATDGDTLALERGVHSGALRIARRVVVRGEPGTVLDGGGRGTVVLVSGTGAALEDLEISGSGRRVIGTDAGIQVLNAAGVAVRRVRMSDVLYGVYAERADRLVIAGCELTGRVTPGDESGEGNGIHLWLCRDPRMSGNRVERFVDGIYLSFVNGAEIRDNRLRRSGRYGLHTMYCQDNALLANHFQENVAGCAIMFSNHLQVRGNDFWKNRGPRTYGLLLRDCSDGEFADNRMVDNTIAIFMDGSNRNRIHDNLFQDDGWGLIVFASCAGNEIAGNDLINCDYPVALDMRRTSNRFDDGRRGNYWSAHAPYDLDGDGLGDVPYSPVGAFAYLSKQFPDLSVLARSPAVAALGVAERVIPALHPSEAVDHHPLLAPVPVKGTGAPLGARSEPAVSWAAAGGFLTLLLLGLGGLRPGKRLP